MMVILILQNLGKDEAVGPGTPYTPSVSWSGSRWLQGSHFPLAPKRNLTQRPTRATKIHEADHPYPAYVRIRAAQRRSRPGSSSSKAWGWVVPVRPGSIADLALPVGASWAGVVTGSNQSRRVAGLVRLEYQTGSGLVGAGGSLLVRSTLG